MISNVTANLVTFYLLGGILANALSADRKFRLWPRLLIFLIWPWMFCVERTPKMAAFIRWASHNNEGAGS